MNNYLKSGWIFLLVLAAGCAKQAVNTDIAVTVNDYTITREEFNQEFKESFLGGIDTPEARKDFLNNLIDRKILLQEAQREGLDRNKEFLRLVERFWEQSLLKIILDKKSKSIAGSVTVSDRSVEEAYNQMKKDAKTDKSYHQMYNQIKWEITKLKEAQLINDWVAGLRSEAKIEINGDILNKKE